MQREGRVNEERRESQHRVRAERAQIEERAEYNVFSAQDCSSSVAFAFDAHPALPLSDSQSGCKCRTDAGLRVAVASIEAALP